jgi:hypothetical protein
MKTKNLAVLLLSCILAGVLAAFMISIRGLLPDVAVKILIALLVLLALAALWVLTWLIKGIFQHISTAHAAVVANHLRTYELKERQERWQLEQMERQAALHVLLSRVQVGNGVYIIQPDVNVLPSQKDVIMLPAAAPIRLPGRAASLGEQQEQELDTGELPTNVLYEEIRHLVPRGHVLVGMGRQGIETKKAAVGACVWIVGLSGSGKTSTTVLRVEERHTAGHKFLGIDPHWFKPDSLTNAIRAYKSDFLLPMATTPEANITVLTAFLDEFNARKAGKRAQPWQPITLLIDETNALMDPTTPEEKQVSELLPSIARICGQEARNFQMGGIFVSQQATGLAWLRKVALMVIVHQLLMESEKKLACNGDMDAAQAMKFWPVGRTYVYGVGFQEGPRTVQQPFYERQADKIYPEDSPGYYEDDEPVSGPGQEEDAAGDTIEALQPRRRTTDELSARLSPETAAVYRAIQAGATGPRALQRELNITYYQAQKAVTELKEKGLIEVD